MTTDEVLQKFLKSYQAYYNIETEECLKPFDAVAHFSVHNEQYMLVKAAKYADVVSNEYVYFYKADTLEEEKVKELTDIAWEDGVNKVVPDSTHRNSDVTVYLICEKISDGAKKLAKKTRHYKSYAFGFKGWSNFRLVAIETSSNEVTYNYQGRLQKKLVSNILTY
ncbi:MAG: hypothetical protein IKY04_07885 [Lachnospiraceae bacterium]|nr:hypothetical protein [Lachnospiraceae bacterium]MBR4994157.1 hypothetical protein [Lachnospiraceae bacterium]